MYDLVRGDAFDPLGEVVHEIRPGQDLPVTSIDDHLVTDGVPPLQHDRLVRGDKPGANGWEGDGPHLLEVTEAADREMCPAIAGLRVEDVCGREAVDSDRVCSRNQASAPDRCALPFSAVPRVSDDETLAMFQPFLAVPVNPTVMSPPSTVSRPRLTCRKLIRRSRGWKASA